MEINVPKELKHPFFFPNENLDIKTDTDEKIPFFYEVLFFTGKEGLRPWEKPEENVSALLEDWTILKEEIRSLFEKRNKAFIPDLMRKGISYCIELLYWSNEQPSVISPRIYYDKLPIKPVNIEERLEFIISRPNLFHSFMQLTELIIEQEKGFKKALAIKKRK
jgi:hypothetical protein